MLVLVPISVSLLLGIGAAGLAWFLQYNPVAWGATGVCLGWVLVYPFRTYRIGTLDPSLVSSLRDEAVIETRRLVVPGHRQAYNPSLIRHRDGYLLSFRIRYHSWATFIKRVVNVKTSFLGIARLNDRFEVCCAPYLLSLQSYSERDSDTAQDGRLIWFDDRILLFFNDYGSTGNRSSCAIYVAVLVEKDGKLRPEGPARMLTYQKMGPIEKNWVPFVADGELYLIYSGEPHCVLQPDVNTGVCKQIACTDTHTRWKWGTIRGGTPACPVDGGFLTFFHSSEFLPAETIFGKKPSRSYAMGAYLFQESYPFAVSSISPPIGSLDDYAENRRKVVFPSGMVVDGDLIHLVWGKNDTRMCLSTLDKKKLLASMIPVSSPQ